MSSQAKENEEKSDLLDAISDVGKGCAAILLFLYLFLTYASISVTYSTVQEIKADIEQIKEETHTMFQIQQEQRAREIKP